ncbi:MAG: ATP phosphoribosyltransferase regulatory subunit [Gammaproteobacteria bacterium]|nr:ATP phosphoribosyltransferase regulatory subunit [Gammaproteobacteria bacterium]
MSINSQWLLPEGVEELLPQQAEHLDRLRRRLLDLFRGWGYELVMPPVMEYLETLLVGRGDDLDLKTFKFTDQLNGRLMGARADITPQIARIDAHHLLREYPSRLCYAGIVLHTRADSYGASREPMQVGAELYGHDGVESDVEIVTLMVETLLTTGIESIYVDLGHVGIFRALAEAAGLTHQQETHLFEVMQRKAKPEMQDMFEVWGLTDRWRNIFMSLVDLNGDVGVIEKARQALHDTDDAVIKALDELQQVATDVLQRLPGLQMHFDLAELRGYHYKTGVVYAAFTPGHGGELARGGRYNQVGAQFGRARPATGFSADLKTLIRVSAESLPTVNAILMPYAADPDLLQLVSNLRAEGERVISLLPGQQGTAVHLGCDRKIIKNDRESWVVVSLS